MNSPERIAKTLEHEEPDKVPLFDFLYNSLSLRRFVGDVRLTQPRIMKVWLGLGFDLVAVGFNAPKGYRVKRVSEGVYQNEWGVLSRSGEGMSWYLDGTIKDREDLEEFSPPNPHAEGRSKNLEWALRRYGERVVVAPPVSGPFTHSWGMMGFSSFVRALYSDPPMIRKLLNIVTDHNIVMGDIALDLGAEYLWISDDFGGTKGPMISPVHFHDFILPCLRRMVRSFKRRGAGVLLHCDGNVMPIMDDIVGTGIDAFHPMERKSKMDIAAMKRVYGDKLALIGNLEASHLITSGSYEQIDEQMRECFQIGAPGGGYIFASDHSIHPAITAERARFVYRRASKYRSYPAGYIS